MGDAAYASLIRNVSDQERELDEHGDDEDDRLPELHEQDLPSPGLFIWILTLSAGISGLLFGYDTGVISSTLVSIGTDLSHRPLTILDKSLITSSTSLFALLASPVSGVLGDTLGRKKVILIADALFVIGAIWQAVATSVWGMIVGRSIIGLAIGAASLVAPLYISELSPSPFRGRLVTVSCLFITGGQVVAYIVGFLLSRTAHGWRLMVGVSAIPAGVQFALLALLPETPRWLVKANRVDEARQVLEKVYSASLKTHDMASGILRAIEKEVQEEEDATSRRHHRANGLPPAKTPHSRWLWLAQLRERWHELIRVGRHRRALIIACMLQALQQLCGFNSLMYFSATIFESLGFASPTLTSLSIALTNFLFTLAAFYLIDRVGRRRILLFSLPIMVLGLVLSSISFSLTDGTAAKTSSPSKTTTTRSSTPTPTPTHTTAILLSLILYVLGFALGIGTVPWQQSELFPLHIRSLGSGLATATNWACNFAVGLTFLPLMHMLGPVSTFAAYAFVCVAGWLAVWRVYPETTGLGLEEVGGLLEGGWGVRR
ncbi:MAG: hypothetical protein M1819_001988 [Sarea resinae]|nr:MAG: hypothetical protein M1819_001988 [Sarea resinae]